MSRGLGSKIWKWYGRVLCWLGVCAYYNGYMRRRIFEQRTFTYTHAGWHAGVDQLVALRSVRSALEAQGVHCDPSMEYRERTLRWQLGFREGDVPQRFS